LATYGTENSKTWNWVSLFKLIGFGVAILSRGAVLRAELGWAGALQIARLNVGGEMTLATIELAPGPVLVRTRDNWF
jgi:hypothetical protein